MLAMLYYNVTVDQCFTGRMTNIDIILPTLTEVSLLMLLSEAYRVDNTVNVVS